MFVLITVDIFSLPKIAKNYLPLINFDERSCFFLYKGNLYNKFVKQIALYRNNDAQHFVSVSLINNLKILFIRVWKIV